jgi:excinuclease ABC subunit C
MNNQQTEYLPAAYSSLPDKSGVYVYLDKENKVIYVGKANNLKNRVSSYFAKSAILGAKTKQLVEKIHKIKITIVESELEALLLEAFYIKKFRPRYNVRLNDDKSYVRIRITIKDAYPAVLLARREDDKNSLYFGPYPNSGAVKLVLKTIRKVFPYQSTTNHPKRICLYNHLGLCPCPPVFDSGELKKEYRKNVSGIIKILEGKSQLILKELEKKRDVLSQNEMYEDANIIQKRINALSIITQPYHKPFEYHINPNLRIDLRQQEMDQLMEYLNKSGFALKKLHRIECYDISNTQGVYATGSMVVFIDGEKTTSEYRRFKIKKDGAPNDFAMMEEVLTRRFKRGGWEQPDLIIVDGGKGQVSSALKALAINNIDIPLIGLAKREETIIIPINSKLETRNSKKIQNTNIKKSKRFENLYLENLDIVADFGFLPAGRQGRASNLNFSEVHLPKSSKALQLIMRIRDEAHRFAITYHRLLRSKNALL